MGKGEWGVRKEKLGVAGSWNLKIDLYGRRTASIQLPDHALYASPSLDGRANHAAFHLFAILLCASFGARPTIGAAYSVKDLGVEFIPLAINERGQIAGENSVAGPTTAFLLDGGVLTPIVPPGGDEVRVRAINNLGQVVGASRDAVGNDHAYVWDTTSGWRNIEPPDVNYSFANGINDARVIVGELFGAATLWQTDGQIIRLGHLGGQYSDAIAVNSAGDVVGLSALDLYGLQQHAFLWRQGAMQDLGVTDTITKGFQEYALGRDINERGQVAGTAVGFDYSVGVYSAPYYGYIWDKSNGLQSLVPDVGFWAINDAGQAVGISSKNGLITWNAMLYENGVLANLNDSISATAGCHLMEATGINNAGQIIAWGISADSSTHGYLLTPVPEPAQLWTVVAGLAVGSCLTRIRGRRLPVSFLAQTSSEKRF